MNFEQQIHFYAGNFPFDRIVIGPFNKIDLASIKLGICFVFATWSGDSVVSFKILCDALAKSPHADFPIYVSDIDDIDRDSFKQTYGQDLNGNGETMWIKDGRVITFDVGYTNKRNGRLHNSDVLQARIGLLSSPESGAANV